MIKIKLSIPGCSSVDINDFKSAIAKFIPGSKNNIADYQFFVNTEIKEADFWFIIDDTSLDTEECLISKNRIFFLSAEVPFVIDYFNSEKFLSQFSKTYSPHAIFDTNNIASLPFLPFMINATYGESIWSYDDKYNFDYLRGLDQIEKTKNMSIVFSNKGSSASEFTFWHKARYNFCIKLKEHFKDKIDFYGQGHNPISSKVDAIFPYKYHICLENQSLYNVMTEKLYDSFLGLSHPIYFGAPNASDYFDERSFSQINIFDFKSSIDVIGSLIEDDSKYDKSRQYLVDSKNKYLDEYSTFPRIAKICNSIIKCNEVSNKEMVTISSRNSFCEKKKVKKSFFKRIKNKIK